MRTEKEIREELALLHKILERWKKSKNDMDIVELVMDITEITARISELEWVLNEDRDDKLAKIIRESIVEDLCREEEK